MKKTSIIGIDLAKTVFQCCGLTVTGKRLFSKQLKREGLLPYLAQIPSCTVAMEACSGAHYWARQIKQLGHSVKIILNDRKAVVTN